MGRLIQFENLKMNAASLSQLTTNNPKLFNS